MNRNCIFSDCRKYRYTLWREWPEAMFDRHDKYLMVVGLNPSTADETKDDPTIRKCIGFAKRWGFGALCMTNLFAWRDTKPENMKAAMFPVGGDNDMWLRNCAAEAGMILAAWGKHGEFLERGKTVANDMQKSRRNIHALKLNKTAAPCIRSTSLMKLNRSNYHDNHPTAGAWIAGVAAVSVLRRASQDISMARSLRMLGFRLRRLRSQSYPRTMEPPSDTRRRGIRADP